MVLLRGIFSAALEDEVIEQNPCDGLELPGAKGDRARSWIYPSEDAQLMRSDAVPLALRVTYGLLIREGLRVSEALALRFGDVDLDRGTLKLDKNKTSDPRLWALGDDVVRTLAW